MRASQPSSPPPPNLIELLEGAEALSRTKDLRSIFRTAAEYAMRFMDGSYGLLFAVRFTPPDLTVSLLGCCVSDGTDTYWDDVCDGQSWLPVDPLLANCLHTDFGHAIVQEGDMWRLAFAVGALGQARWVLEIHSPAKPRDAACNALSVFLRCFENQHQQWDYANLDTLTRLLNRKTFDDDFERLIAAAELAEQARKSPVERREAGQTVAQTGAFSQQDLADAGDLGGAVGGGLCTLPHDQNVDVGRQAQSGGHGLVGGVANGGAVVIGDDEDSHITALPQT